MLVHKKAFAKSCALLKRLKAGEEIWGLLKELHDAPDNEVPAPDTALKRETKALLNYNMKELLALRGKLVPTMVVTKGEKTCIYSGPKAIRTYLEESRPKGVKVPLWNLGEPSVCAPDKECQ